MDKREHGDSLSVYCSQQNHKPNPSFMTSLDYYFSLTKRNFVADRREMNKLFSVTSFFHHHIFLKLVLSRKFPEN